MEWVGAAIALLAAAAAIWQAWEARRARNAAVASSAEAKEHERRAVEVAERQARAIEESTELARAAATAYQVPWVVIQETKERWKVKLGGSEDAVDVRVGFSPDDADLDLLEDPPQTMRPGEAIFVLWGKTFDSPAAATIEVFWKRPRETEERVFRESVS